MPTAITEHFRGSLRSLRHPVVALGFGLVALQLAFRGAAIFNGWFYADDFEFLHDATNRQLTFDYMLTPHDSQLMPAGNLAAWCIANSGAFNWSAAATTILLLQLAASTACWVMLCKLFGPRWECLAILAVYLFSTLTITAYMWWAAAINHLPFQLAFFMAMTFHVTYLRTRRLSYSLFAGLALVLGLCFYVKTALIVIPMTVVTWLYFTGRDQSAGTRIRQMIKDNWRAWLLYAVPLTLYVAYYVRFVPNPIAADVPIAYADLLDAMIRVSLGTASVGGPWEWSQNNPPLGQVATAEWAITLSWMAIGIAAALALRSGRGDWRAVLVIAPYLGVSYLLVARGRATQLGGFAGLELRYLADFTPVLTLGIALFTLRLGTHVLATTPSRRLVSADWRLAVSVACGSALVVGAAVSNIQYVRFWTDGFPAESFAKTVIYESSQEPLVVVDEPVPELVMSATSFPSNLPSQMFKNLGVDRIRAVSQGTDLDMLDGSGQPFPAVVASGATARPGPVRDCGYPVRSEARAFATTGDPGFFWWMQVSYLANQNGSIRINVGGTTHELPVFRGPHRLFVRGEGAIDDLSVRALETTTGLCVDGVNIGPVTAMEPLS